MLISAELVKPSASYKLKWLVVSGVRETMVNKHQQKHISGEIKGMNPTCSTFPPPPQTKHPQEESGVWVTALINVPQVGQGG